MRSALRQVGDVDDEVDAKHYARRGRGGHSKQRAATSDSLSPLSTSARGSALRLLPDAPFLAAKHD